MMTGFCEYSKLLQSFVGEGIRFVNEEYAAFSAVVPKARLHEKAPSQKLFRQRLGKFMTAGLIQPAGPEWIRSRADSCLTQVLCGEDKNQTRYLRVKWKSLIMLLFC